MCPQSRMFVNYFSIPLVLQSVSLSLTLCLSLFLCLSICCGKHGEQVVWTLFGFVPLQVSCQSLSLWREGWRWLGSTWNLQSLENAQVLQKSPTQSFPNIVGKLFQQRLCVDDTRLNSSFIHQSEPSWNWHLLWTCTKACWAIAPITQDLWYTLTICRTTPM